MSDFLSILLILAGPAAGSFAALLADRLPRGEPVIVTRSRCRACGRRLPALHLIPIISYPLLGGRCAPCNAPIPAYLWHAEIVGLLLGTAAVLGTDTAVEALLGAALLWCLLALTLADLMHFRLPNQLTGLLLILAVGQAVFRDGGLVFDGQFRLALAGGAVGFGSFWLLREAYEWYSKREGLGFGDVKLMAGIGAAVGPFAIPYVTLLAAVSAMMLILLRSWRKGRKVRRTARIPFGAALSGSAIIMWIAIQSGNF